MSPRPDCVVYVDGKRVNDDAPSLADALDPVALDGLRITWGRETTVDQPDAATLTMTLRDPEGGRSFLEGWRVGSLVRVEATGPSWSTDPGGGGDDSAWGPNLLPYGTFEGVTLDELNRYSYWPAPERLQLVMGPMGGTALRYKHPLDASEPQSSLILTAAPVATPSDPPGAWDGVPRIGAAYTKWRIQANVRAHYAEAFVCWATVQHPYTSQVRYRGSYGVALDLTGQWANVDHEIRTVESGADVRDWPVAFLNIRLATWDDPRGLAAWPDANGSWDDLRSLEVDDLSVSHNRSLAQSATVVPFEGRVTDLVLSVDSLDRPTVAVTAMDAASELGNRVVGDEPWPAETLAERAARIMAAAGTGLTLFIDAGLRQRRVSYQDVDAQDVVTLLRTLAQSVDAVLWVSTHPTIGAYLRMEDMGARAPLFALALVDGLVTVRPSAGERVLRVSACDVLTDPVTFTQSVADVVNTVALTWLEQTTNDEGKPAPTERTIVVTDPALVTALGTRRIATSTVLADEAPARAVANSLLARTSVTDWRVEGLALEAALLARHGNAALSTATRLLDGTARNGLPMFLVDLPLWAPAVRSASVYLEGGTYTYENTAWSLELTASAAQAQGLALSWAALSGPGYRWQQFDPALAWQEIVGVTPTRDLQPL